MDNAVTYVQRLCYTCHGLPYINNWLDANETSDFNVFHIAKRQGLDAQWQPLYIVTNEHPCLEERFVARGSKSKRSQLGFL